MPYTGSSLYLAANGSQIFIDFFPESLIVAQFVSNLCKHGGAGAAKRTYLKIHFLCQGQVAGGQKCRSVFVRGLYRKAATTEIHLVLELNAQLGGHSP